MNDKTVQRWPSLSYARRVFIFYLTIWLASGALALIAMCFWYQPFFSSVAAQQIVLTGIVAVQFRYAWRRLGRPDVYRTLAAVHRKLRRELAHGLELVVSFFTHYGLRAN